MKKLILLAVFIIGQTILQSCCDEEDVCFNLQLIGVENYSLQGVEVFGPQDTVSMDSYAILLQSSTIDQVCQANLSLGSALYALSCEDPLFRLRNEVTQVSITADAELRSDLPAGAELKQLFFPAELYLPCLEETGLVADCLRNYYEIEGVESLEEAINQHMAQNFFFQGSFFSEDEVLHFFSLQRGMNVNTGTYTFTVSFDFQDGTSVDLVTEEVVLQ